MLLVVAVASLAIGQVATGIVVGLLVAFNVVMGTNQQRKASARGLFARPEGLEPPTF